jgi:NAD(P)-dependent dehydrogenase (short-subunit alcohol dehydrogenase family)
VADLADPETARAVAIQAWHDVGGLDVVVNNAGITDNCPAEELGLGEFRRVLEVNLTATFALSQLAGRRMIAGGGGSIVNIASVVVRTPMVQFGAYSAAKSAVVSLTETMAIEWAPEVRVNSLLVGHIDTERARRRRTKEDEVWLERHIALRRMGTPDDVAGAAVFLASTQSAWMTGAAIPVDGGMRAV